MLYEVTKDGLTLSIEPEIEPIDPRESENITTLYGWHRRYSLGDKNPYPEPDDFFESDEYKDIYVSLPVFLLDHSGLHVSVNDFNDPWDSGRLGTIFITKEKAKEVFGEFSPAVYKACVQTLIEEVEEYEAYLNGDVYMFTVINENGDILDGCGNFSGYKSDKTLLSAMRENTDDIYAFLFDELITEKTAKKSFEMGG